MKFIVSLFVCTALYLLCFFNSSYSQTEQLILNVKDFGAKGNGIYNDYNALKKVTDSINKLKHGTIYFPEGTYYVAEYNKTSDTSLNLKFTNCNNVTIKAYNAIINLNGNFKRTADIKKGKISYSNQNSVIPFYFSNCSNISIYGIEINGNVDQMTHENSVVEKGAGLITFIATDHITLKDIFVHHSASDGVYVGAGKRNCSYLTMINVKSLNNARQGLSITGLRNAQIQNCTFANTGFTGNYGFHRPAAGVDIEPVRLLDNTKTGDIHFNNCIFENNIGGQFLCTKPSLTSNISIQNSVFNGIDSFSRYQVILAADSVFIDHCNFNLGRGNIFPTWAAAPGSKVTIQNCSISSSMNGILSASKNTSDFVIIENNNFKFTGDTSHSYFPYLQTTNLIFRNNEIFFPSGIVNKKSFSSLIQNAQISEGNKFKSDRNNFKPQVSYQGTKKVKDF